MKNLSILFLLLVILLSGCEEQIIDGYQEDIIETQPERELLEYIINGETVILEKINGDLIFQGDIVIAPEQLEEMGTKGCGIFSSGSGKWPNNLLFYSFNANVTSSNRQIIRNALKVIQDNTNVLFCECEAALNRVIYNKSTVNNSLVGGLFPLQMSQTINIANFVSGTIIHETLHALGLEHEQCRSDRDNYLTIHYDNIISGYAYAFDKISLSNRKDYGSGVDFQSIMLYDSYAFSKLPGVLPTITKKNATGAAALFTDNNTLSTRDISTINSIYPAKSQRSYLVNASIKSVGIVDYDGDKRADISVIYDDNIYIDYSKNGFGRWDWIGGRYSGELWPADYDGDGKIDIATRMPNGQYNIDYANNGFGSFDFYGYMYGAAEENCCPADLDGDRKADIVIRTLNGEFRVDYARNGFGSFDNYYPGYGYRYDQICPADFDGDGKADLALRTEDSKFRIDYAKNGFGRYDIDYGGYGTKADVTVCADYDGDGKADFAVKTNTEWRIDYSRDGLGTYNTYIMGCGGIAAHGDYDGDGKVDVAVKQSATGKINVDYQKNGFSLWDLIIY